jgi:hypothetical protein
MTYKLTDAEREALVKIISEQSGWQNTTEDRWQIIRRWYADVWPRMGRLFGHMTLLSPSRSAEELVDVITVADVNPNTNALQYLIGRNVLHFRSFNDQDFLVALGTKLSVKVTEQITAAPPSQEEPVDEYDHAIDEIQESINRLFKEAAAMNQALALLRQRR